MEAREAVGWILGKTGAEHIFHSWIPRIRYRCGLMQALELQPGRSSKWEATCNHLVQHDAEGINISADIDVFSILVLFGRHVRGSPQHRSSTRHSEAHVTPVLRVTRCATAADYCFSFVAT